MKENVEFEEMEEEIYDLQNGIHNIERRIRATDTERKYDVEENILKTNENDSEINSLLLQINELEVRMKKSQKADENLISKVFQEYDRNTENWKGKSPKETLKMLDSELLKLEKKTQSLDHELQIKKRNVDNSEQQYQAMTTKCNKDFENEPTEYETVEHVRELEKEHQDLAKYILECEVAQGRYKAMKEQLEMNRHSYPLLYLDVETKCETLEESEEGEESTDARKVESAIEEATGSTSSIVDDSSEIHTAYSKIASPMKSATLSVAAEQRCELQDLQEAFNKIKGVVGVHDIQDAERRFLLQKSMHVDLSDLKKRATKYLHELKTEKKQLDSKLQFLQGSETDGLKWQLEKDLKSSEERKEEQERRKESAKQELDKTSLLLAEVESRLLSLSKKLRKQFVNGGDSTDGLTAFEISRKIENLLHCNMNTE